MNPTNPSSNPAASRASDDLRALLQDAEMALSNAGDTADGKIAELRERLRSAMDRAMEKGGDAYQKVRESAREQMDHADRYVRSHPYQAVGTAIAVGAFIGLLIGRRLP